MQKKNQDEFEAIYTALEKYGPRKSDYVTARKKSFNKCKKKL